MTHQFCFPLSLQTVLPEDYEQNKSFCNQMEVLQRYGFSGVELNMTKPLAVDLAQLTQFLSRFDLKLTQFASGLTAKTLGLSLSSADEAVRRNSVDFCRSIFQWLTGSEAGVIIGFLKGPAVTDITLAATQFSRSLKELAPEAERAGVSVLIEATNRYESAIANSLEGTAELLQNSGGATMRLLPDTFHMNIEEADANAALTRYKSLYQSVHISDNNRFYPGHGAIDFGRVVHHLKGIGYAGGLAIEGNLKHGFEKDLEITMRYLSPILSENT